MRKPKYTTWFMLMLLVLLAPIVFSSTLVWDANTEEDLAGYIVCVVDTGECFDVDNVTYFSLDWTPAEVYITVEAYDFTGNISNCSEEIYWEGYDCLCDFDFDGDVDGVDTVEFKEDYFRKDCDYSNPCVGDTDSDGDVDGTDALVFKSEFFRRDCKWR